MIWKQWKLITKDAKIDNNKKQEVIKAKDTDENKGQ